MQVKIHSLGLDKLMKSATGLFDHSCKAFLDLVFFKMIYATVRIIAPALGFIEAFGRKEKSSLWMLKVC
jgi:hypothetical protein